MGRVAGTVLLLICSNAFMTYAWYFHLQRVKTWPLWLAIGISWLIALPEYILQVPANRLGSTVTGGPFTLPQLKILQEAITLTVFTVFAVYVAKDRPRTTDYVAFGLVLAAVAVSMLGRAEPRPPEPTAGARAAAPAE